MAVGFERYVNFEFYKTRNVTTTFWDGLKDM